MPTLIKGSATKQLEAVTAEQHNVNNALQTLYDKHKQRIHMLKTAEDIKQWCREEFGREDYDWFYGELLMMVAPSFVNIGPEQYNRLMALSHEFKEQDSWYGLHLKLGYRQVEKDE